jgi:type I restriction enzyme R subunit
VDQPPALEEELNGLERVEFDDGLPAPADQLALAPRPAHEGEPGVDRVAEHLGDGVRPPAALEHRQHDPFGVEPAGDVGRFCSVYFKPKQRQSAQDHQAMNAALDPAVSRFAVLQRDEESEAELWRGKVQAFRNLYAFLSQVIPYQDSDLERLYVFLRYLAAKLPRRRGGPAYQFDDDVRLEY